MELKKADPDFPMPGQEPAGSISGLSLPKFTFFIYDHPEFSGQVFGNSRILYTNKFIDCNPDSTKYLLEHSLSRIHFGMLDYYPFGKTLREYVHVRERHQTTYHERDVETGLDYRGARFYDAEMGRFLRVDPLALKYAEWSTYTYTLNNPIRFIDPDGMEADDVYYDQNGNYLYEDNQTTDNIRIIGKEDFALIAFKHSGQMNDKNSTDLSLISDLAGNSKLISETELSVQAVSKITTDILDKMTDVDASKLLNGKVSVIDFRRGNEFNDPDSQGSFANTLVTENGIKITVPISSGKIDKDMSTVSNVQNALGAHEFQGHGILGFGSKTGSHSKAYEHQFNHPSWNATTPSFKEYMKENHNALKSSEKK